MARRLVALALDGARPIAAQLCASYRSVLPAGACRSAPPRRPRERPAARPPRRPGRRARRSPDPVARGKLELATTAATIPEDATLPGEGSQLMGLLASRLE
jgi:hypothetical protein